MAGPAPFAGRPCPGAQVTTEICLFTADLRLHDNPVLYAAVRGADSVVPLFVYDRGVRDAGFAAPNRRAFLADCLADLDAGLRARGGRLVVREGEVVREVCALARRTGARAVHVAAGSSGYAQRREERLRKALEEQDRRLHVHEAVTTVLPPGEVLPQGKDHFAVFTPYFRRWTATAPRETVPLPRSVHVPDSAVSHRLEDRADVSGTSPGLARGGEKEARRRLTRWLGEPLDGYAEHADELDGAPTSRLSPHLHFGTLSPIEVAARARESGSPGAEPFVRQVAWRDFNHQVLAARPAAAHEDYRPRQDRWRRAAEEAEAWRAGRTGFPVVDAAMRQLRHEGWMPGRARLLVASFFSKTLYLDWRVGARHFLDLLVDGDVANNQLNWQWAAGTGTDTRPGRVLNPLTQSQRFDPDGSYVRRWVPELGELRRPAVHEPWRLSGAERSRLDYPEPLVDLAEGLARFRRARGLD